MTAAVSNSRPATGSGCARARAATSWISRWPGRLAIIEAIEQDYEGKIQVAVVLDDDPGKDLGMLRQPGHRFFFSAGRGRAGRLDAASGAGDTCKSTDSRRLHRKYFPRATTASGSKWRGVWPGVRCPEDVRVNDFGSAASIWPTRCSIRTN